MDVLRATLEGSLLGAARDRAALFLTLELDSLQFPDGVQEPDITTICDQIRDRIVSKIWKDFVPRHPNYRWCKLDFHEFQMALWTGDHPSLEERATAGIVQLVVAAKQRERAASLGAEPLPAPIGKASSESPTAQVAKAVQRGAAKAPRRQHAARPDSTHSVTSTAWKDVEIWFLSEERIEIKTDSRTETRNFGEMGFANKRNGSPKAAWLKLREMAESEGTVRATFATRAELEKRVQEIRAVLRAYFNLEDDPFETLPREKHAHASVGYRAKFKIGCRPSYWS
jgi:hypothetical protein